MDFKLGDIINIIFRGSINNDGVVYTYKDIPDEKKEEFFFIINRFMSKRYPTQAQFFNKQNMDKITALDIWNLQIKKGQYPSWFWSGSRKKKEPKINNWKLFHEYNEDLDMNDVFMISEMFPDEMKQEIKYYEELEKEKQR